MFYLTVVFVSVSLLQDYSSIIPTMFRFYSKLIIIIIITIKVDYQNKKKLNIESDKKEYISYIIII